MQRRKPCRLDRREVIGSLLCVTVTGATLCTKAGIVCNPVNLEVIIGRDTPTDNAAKGSAACLLQFRVAKDPRELRHVVFLRGGYSVKVVDQHGGDNKKKGQTERASPYSPTFFLPAPA